MYICGVSTHGARLDVPVSKTMELKVSKDVNDVRSVEALPPFALRDSHESQTNVTP